MKKITTVLIALFMFSEWLSAQINKDDWMTGGNLRINTAKNNSQFEFSPSIGYFLIDGLAMGARLSYQMEKLGSNSVSGLGFGPFARYYFGNEKLFPFFEGAFDLSNRKYKTGTQTTTEQAFSVFGGGGLAIFLNENVALEGMLGFRNSRVKNQSGNGGLNLRVGFQVYLNRRQVDGVRSKLAL
jgi:outer membrane protein